MDECQRPYAKWDKPVTERQILYDSTDIKHINRQICRDRK